MSLLPAFVHALKRKDDSALQADADTDSDRDNIFDLVPPESAQSPKDEPTSRDGRPVEMTDLSRLSIDDDGRLYWDGKPVETHHRYAMSRRQIIGASIVAAFIVIGALGAAVQGAAAARGWACWLGWSAGACSGPASHSSDIPA
jgi:hypothetical protein